MDNAPSPSRNARPSWRHVVSFLILSCLLVGAAAANFADWGIWSTLFLYPAVSFLILSIAYAGVGCSLFGKRADGRCSAVSLIWFGPYYAFNELGWLVYRATTREPAIAQVAPNLFLGRRLTRHEVGMCARYSFKSCLDLTAEFTEPAFLSALPNYRSFPILDGTAPTSDELATAIAWIGDATAAGPTYVHCALGHGRTGTIVIAYLVAANLATDVDSAMELLRLARPESSINRQQRCGLEKFLVERKVEH